MGRKKFPGLIKRAGHWHVDKRICGRRVCQGTGTAELEEAEAYLARLMEQSVFIVPGSRVKNGDERLVVLNRVARSVIDARRGNHGAHVFVFDQKPIQHMLN